MPGHDLHDSPDGVRPVEGALRTADDFDAFEVGHRQMGEVESAAEGVRAHPVDQDEREVRFAAARKQRRDASPPAALGHGEPRHQAERVRDRLDLTILEKAGVDHRDAVGCVRERSVHVRRRHHHGFGDCADPQRDGDLPGLVAGEIDVGRFPAKSGDADAHLVPSGVERGELEAPLCVGGRGGGDRQRLREQHPGSRHHAAVRVDDASGQLRPGHKRGCEQDTEGDEDEYEEKGRRARRVWHRAPFGVIARRTRPRRHRRSGQKRTSPVVRYPDSRINTKRRRPEHRSRFAPRSQWRHRVGVTPTSLGHREASIVLGEHSMAE